MLQIFDKLSAKARHLFAVAALGLAFILPLATFVYLAGDSAQNQFPDKISAPETPYLLNNPAVPLLENATTANSKLQTANSSGGDAFFSFANLQKNLEQNLASVIPSDVFLWIFGVGFFVIRLGSGVWQLQKYKTREILSPDKYWRERFSVLCVKLRIAQTEEN